MSTPLPPATNIVKCVYSGTYGGAKWANVFHVRYAPGPPSQADMNSLCTALHTQWGTNLKALFSSTASLTQTSLIDLSSNTGLQATTSSTIAGTVAGNALPANVALVVSFKIPRRYRGGHPRQYLTGQVQTNTANNTSWGGTWPTTVQTAMEAWRQAINALTYTSMPTIQLVNLSYYSGGALRATPIFDSVTAIAVHTRVDTQRRRLGKETA